MLTIALLITVPLLARFLVASRMEVLRKQLLTSDGEYSQLRARYEHLVEDLRQARNQKRQYELRASFVAQDVRVETQVLSQLREHAAPAPAPARRAA